MSSPTIRAAGDSKMNARMAGACRQIQKSPQ